MANKTYETQEQTEDTKKHNIVYFNKEFNEKVPMYYIDSGIVISFGLIKLLEDGGMGERDIKRALIRGNPHNIDYKTANKLMELYEQNKNGEVAFCIPPIVYKETMIDSKRHDDINRRYTRKFVTEHCFLSFPNEKLQSFARKSYSLQKKFKAVKSPDGIFGLNTDMKKKRVVDGEPKVLVDDNFEDRLILAQIAIMVKQGKQNANIISCATDVYGTSQKVQELYDEEKFLDDLKENINEHVDGDGSEKATFIQINSSDFGTKVSIEHQSSNEIRGKRSVATQLEETLNTFFEGKGELSVRTPLELE